MKTNICRFDWTKKDNLILSMLCSFYALLAFFWGGGALFFGSKSCCEITSLARHPFYFFPYISQFIFKTVDYFLGPYAGFFFGQVFLPTAVFALLVKIFRRNLSLTWAIGLSLLSISVIAEYPFNQFLVQILSGKWAMLGSDRLPELLYFPIPSFSTCYFLVIFYLATCNVNIFLDLTRLSSLTILFSLIAYINAIDVVFALPFWFIYFPLKLYRRNSSLIITGQQVFLQLILTSLIIAPAFLLADFGISRELSSTVSIYYISMYLCVPLILVGILFFVQRIDPYDLLYRFRHVYILMLTEVFVLLVVLTGIVPVNLQIFQNRLAQFFMHTYYYLPVIYYASQVKFAPVFGLEGLRISRALRAALHCFFGRYSAFYLLPLMALLCIYNLTSCIKHFEKCMYA